MAIKTEEGKALMARPSREELFLHKAKKNSLLSQTVAQPHITSMPSRHGRRAEERRRGEGIGRAGGGVWGLKKGGGGKEVSGMEVEGVGGEKERGGVDAFLMKGEIRDTRH